MKDVGYLFNGLMEGLGFGGGYVAQGGDIGSYVSNELGANYPACKSKILIDHSRRETAEEFMKSFTSITLTLLLAHFPLQALLDKRLHRPLLKIFLSYCRSLDMLSSILLDQPL